jgi:adenylate cyclase
MGEGGKDLKKIMSWRALVSISPLKIALILMMFFLGFQWRHYSNDKRSQKLDWVGILESNLIDIRFKLRGARPVSGQVGILAIDEQSVAKFGRWPFPRSVYEPALNNLKKAGVQVIGWDSVFSEPERTYLDESIDDLQVALGKAIQPKGFDTESFGDSVSSMINASKGDLSFGRAQKNFGKIVHGYFYFETIEGLSYNWMHHFNRLAGASAIDFVSFDGDRKLKDFPEILVRGALTNTPEIAPNGSQMGFFNNSADSDGIVRRATLLKGLLPTGEKGETTGDPILVPSLSLAVASQYLNREVMVKFDNLYGVKSIELMDPSGESDAISIPQTIEGVGRTLINHYGPEGTFPHISLASAYEGKFSSKVPKILLVGAVGTGMNDIRASPFSETFNGVEHHAALLENVLSENFLRRSINAPLIEYAILIVSGLFFAFLLTNASMATSALVLVGVSILYFFVDRYFVFGKGYWIYMGGFYLQSYSIFLSVTLFKYFTEEKEKKKIKNAFQHYLNPSVINELMENPDSLKLGGQKKELTVFFSDVRGFTTISESLSPEALSGLLNEYFTPMTDIVLASGGLLDKYIGDAMMAVWGAPIPLEDHPDRALLASLQMLDVLDGLREGWKARGLPMIDIGCGVNTGQMVVGNMGSNQRFDYTVLGDSVNLGSRLEAVTKNYGVKIICSEMTAVRLKNPGQFVLRELDSIQVKGKNDAVGIFECMRIPKGQMPLMQDIAGQFKEALDFYRKQEWDQASVKLNQILRLRPDDGPSLEFLNRIEYLQAHLPGNDWNGVWVMKTK